MDEAVHSAEEVHVERRQCMWKSGYVCGNEAVHLDEAMHVKHSGAYRYEAVHVYDVVHVRRCGEFVERGSACVERGGACG